MQPIKIEFMACVLYRTKVPRKIGWRRYNVIDCGLGKIKKLEGNNRRSIEVANKKRMAMQ